MKKKKIIIAAVVLLLLFLIGGAIAYFTDTDAKTNTFTIGNVDIEVQEAAWDALADVNNNDIPDDAEDMMPGESVSKDPLIHNKSTSSEAYVFMKVVSPCTTGTTPVELFDYTTTPGVNSGWELMSAYTNATCSQGSITRVYSYSTNGTMTALDPETSASTDDTATLFDTLTLNTAVTGDIPSSTNIAITGYAIQVDGLLDSNDQPITSPSGVWTAANGFANN